MSESLMTGTRARNRRLDLGLRQAHVAREIGISASYLHLIEHNRRPIGAKLLRALASVLEVDSALLEQGRGEAVLGPMSEAAAAFPAIGIEDGRAEELVARFPGWASLIGAQQARIAQLEDRVAALSNRLAHDTQIAASLHEVISTATAIRSTASILAETPDLEADWRGRFHANIDADAGRLALSSQALLGYLDREAEFEAGGLEASPLEQAEAVQAARGFYLPEAEAGEIAQFGEVPHAATREILHDWAVRAVADAARLPLTEFAQAARALAFDPARLAARFGVGLEMVMRRLVHLPDHAEAPLMGLVECDAAGVVTFQKPVLEFRLPRAGAACPLWPLYQALSQPGRVIHATVRLVGAARTPFECFAIAAPFGEVSYEEQPQYRATMLVRPARAEDGAQPVGPGCRVCAVQDCRARRHPSLL